MRLNALIPSVARVKVLTLLLLGGEGKYYVREIERRTGENINSVRRELANLEGAGIVLSSRVANLKYFSINRSNPVYSELRSMFLKTEGVAGLVRDRLARHGELKHAFIFGSFASGGEGPSSDVDLFLVGDVDDKTVARNVKEIEDFLGRQVNDVVMSAKEFEKRLRDKEPFVSRVMSSPRIPLLGEEVDAIR